MTNIDIAVESYEDINFIQYHYKKRGKQYEKENVNRINERGMCNESGCWMW
jgi:hypothetical protein